MSLFDVNYKSSTSSALVEKILEQGQRLRNSMVEAILNNDPLNQEILYSAPILNTERKNTELVCTCGVSSNKSSENGINKVFQRENYLPLPLDTHHTEFHIKEPTLASNPCHHKVSCDICNDYENFYLRSPSTSSNNSIILTRQVQLPPKGSKQTKHVPSSKLKPKEQTVPIIKNVSSEKITLLKYVDSLKIMIYSLKLNNAGYRKIILSQNIDKQSTLVANNSYFIEYSLPDFLIKNLPKTRAKINTGLNTNKTRYCTKKIDDETIYFRQKAIHSVCNVNLVDLNNMNIVFNISFRTVRQKASVQIGKATFNFGSLINSKYLNSEQELVLLSENAPVTLGTLKVSLQFGCDKLYFGKEFIDAISCSKENSNLSENDSIHKLEDDEISSRKTKKPVTEQKEIVLHSAGENNSKISEPIKESNLLCTLIFLSEVQLFTEPIDSYIICRGFTRDDTITSKTVFDTCNPKFYLYQIIPILLDEDFVNRLRDNYIIIEVWQSKDHDQLIGICKLPIHQFYVAYRNPEIVKHLSRSPHPVIAVDWWEPVINPVSNSETGQLRSIVALGTSSQIEFLEQSRGLKDFAFNNRTIVNKNNDKTTKAPSKYRNSSVKLTGKYPSTVQVDVIPNTELNVQVRQDNSNFLSKNYSSFAQIDDNSDKDSSIEFVQEEIIASVKTDKNPNLLRKYSPPPRSPLTQIDSLERTESVRESPEVTDTIASIKQCNNISNKIDASTQSEHEMDNTQKSKDSTTNESSSQFNHRELLNSFLEQLMNARDVNQRNRFVETSTNTEELVVPTTEPIEIVNENITPSPPPPPVAVTNTEVSNANNIQQQQQQQQQQFVLPTSNANNISLVESNNLSIRNTSDLLDSLQKALSLSIDNKPHEISVDLNSSNEDAENKINDKFKVHIVIEGALHLPSRKKCKSKKNKTKQHSKQNEEILPSTYVTFTGFSDSDFYITNVIPKSTSPKWDYRNDIYLPIELLLNNQKRMIFKVWRKANGPNLQPNFQTDIVIGFATLDLTVFLSGLPTVQGWFNIIDFSSAQKSNGQIKINVTPLEDLSKFNRHKNMYVPEKLNTRSICTERGDNVGSAMQVANAIKLHEPQLPTLSSSTNNDEALSSELFSRALKRKFTELDEITQRLRQRLSAVTNDDSDQSNDAFADEFEQDLNTICIEDDIELEPKINSIESRPATGKTSNSNMNSLLEQLLAESKQNNFTVTAAAAAATSKLIYQPTLSSNPSTASIDGSNESDGNQPATTASVQENLAKLDGHLTEGKLKIDSLLEKLSLLTNDIDTSSSKSFANRYVSGCSDYFSNHLPETSRTPPIDSVFNPLAFQELYANEEIHQTTLKHLIKDLSSSSGSSSSTSATDVQSVVSTNSTKSRQAPDGAGNLSNESQRE